MNIVENPRLESLQFDYSACRSPSRARRRYKRGIVGRVKVSMKPYAMQVGDTIYMHPMLAEKFRQHVAEKAVDVTLDFIRNLFPAGFGGSFGGIIPPGGYATGGTVGKLDPPRRVGERGVEFIMPRASLISGLFNGASDT